MAMIGEPQRVIISEPVFSPIPEREPEQPQSEPIPVEPEAEPVKVEP